MQNNECARQNSENGFKTEFGNPPGCTGSHRFPRSGRSNNPHIGQARQLTSDCAPKPPYSTVGGQGAAPSAAHACYIHIPPESAVVGSGANRESDSRQDSPQLRNQGGI